MIDVLALFTGTVASVEPKFNNHRYNAPRCNETEDAPVSSWLQDAGASCWAFNAERWNDLKIIATDEHNIAMGFRGTRHFRH